VFAGFFQKLPDFGSAARLINLIQDIYFRRDSGSVLRLVLALES
jgi:hypothetical protein